MSQEELARRYFLSRLLYWRDALMELDYEAVNALALVLDKVKLDMDVKLQAEAEGLAEITDWSRERMQALSAWCDETLAGAKAAMNETVEDASASACQASLEHYNKTLSFDGKASLVATVGMSYGQIKSWFQETPLGGHLLQGWIDRAFDAGAKQSLLRSLRQSGIEGKGTAAAVRRLLQTALDEGFNITKREAITIARTYIQTANVEAQRAVYDANPDIVYGYEWLSVLDNRVCIKCAVLDGTKYRRGEKMPPVPCHPRCRCLLRPLVRIKALGITSEDLGNVARNWVVREPGNIDEGGKRKILAAGTTSENFGGWFDSLSDRQKEGIVGKARFGLLKEGKIRWEDLVNKKSGQVLSLEDLGFTRSGNTLAAMRSKLQAEADAIRKTLSLPENQKEIKEWITNITDNIQKGVFHGKGDRKVVGAFDDNVLKFLKNEGIILETPEMSISDKNLMHASRDKKPKKLSLETWTNIQNLLSTPKAVYWNLFDNALVYVIQNKEILGKIIIQTNFLHNTKTKIANGKKRSRLITNNVRTGAEIENLREFFNCGWYKKIE